MNYTESLIASAQPNAAASVVSDLLIFATAEGVPAGDAIADRRALQAALNAPKPSEIEAADKATTNAADALGNARTALERAQQTLDIAEADYVQANAVSTELRIKTRAAEDALKRPAVALAAKGKTQ